MPQSQPKNSNAINSTAAFTRAARLCSQVMNRCPTVAAEEILQLFVSDPGKKSRVVDFVSVQVQNRQNGAVANGVEELADVPRCRQRARFRLAIAHDCGRLGRDDIYDVIKSLEDV